MHLLARLLPRPSLVLAPTALCLALISAAALAAPSHVEPPTHRIHLDQPTRIPFGVSSFLLAPGDVDVYENQSLARGILANAQYLVDLYLPAGTEIIATSYGKATRLVLPAGESIAAWGLEFSPGSAIDFRWHASVFEDGELYFWQTSVQGSLKVEGKIGAFAFASGSSISISCERLGRRSGCEDNNRAESISGASGTLSQAYIVESAQETIPVSANVKIRESNAGELVLHQATLLADQLWQGMPASAAAPLRFYTEKESVLELLTLSADAVVQGFLAPQGSEVQFYWDTERVQYIKLKGDQTVNGIPVSGEFGIKLSRRGVLTYAMLAKDHNFLSATLPAGTVVSLGDEDDGVTLQIALLKSKGATINGVRYGSNTNIQFDAQGRVVQVWRN